MKAIVCITSICLLWISYTQANICPLEEHLSCNEETPKHACVCAVIKHESSPPRQSCNQILNIKGNEFEAASVTFNLDEAAERFDTFPQQAFKKEIASALKVQEKEIIIVRVGCADKDSKLVVQFLILGDDDGSMARKIDTTTLKSVLKKKNSKASDVKKIVKKSVDSNEDSEEEAKEEDDSTEDNENSTENSEEEDDDVSTTEKTSDEDDTDSEEDKKDESNGDSEETDKKDDSKEDDSKEDDSEEDKKTIGSNVVEKVMYDQEQFVDAESIVSKMKVMGHMSEISDLAVEKIEVVKTLIDIESDQDNTVLILQCILMVLAVILTCIGACCLSCKKQGYSDDLQKV
uniref:Spore coat protein n=1 Tax=Rhabditophanes sp. KR3021 TaxID=114890 RepID=A0AC35TL08_9BILA